MMMWGERTTRSSRPSLTPWLADFCLSQVLTTSPPTPDESNVSSPPKLVQILSRGGSFWTKNYTNNNRNLQTTKNTHRIQSRSTTSQQTAGSEEEAMMVVTDGHHSIVVHLSRMCQDVLIREHLQGTPPGSDPWLLFQRGSVGIIQSYQLQNTTTTTTAATSSTSSTHNLTLVVGRWDCQPELHGRVVDSRTHLTMIQPVLEHIPVRRALYNRTMMEVTSTNNVDTDILVSLTSTNHHHIGDPMEAMQNPQLLQELLEIATTAQSCTTNSSGDSDDDDDDEIQDSDDGTVESANSYSSDDADPVKNLRDMLGREADDTDDEIDDYTAPLSSQPLITATTKTTTAATTIETDPSQTDDDTTMILLTQPPFISVDHPSITTTPTTSPAMVDSSTQTLASTLKEQVLTLRLALPPPPIPQRPTAMVEREVTTPTSNQSKQLYRTHIGGGGSGTTTSTHSSQPKRRRILSTPDDYSIAPSSTTTTTTTSTTRSSSSSRVRRSYWKQVCAQLDRCDDTEQDMLITVEIDSRSRDVLRQGGLSRWLHTNLLTTTSTDPSSSRSIQLPSSSTKVEGAK